MSFQSSRIYCLIVEELGTERVYEGAVAKRELEERLINTLLTRAVSLV